MGLEMVDPMARRTQLEGDLAEAERLLSLTDNVRLTDVITAFRGQALRDLQALPVPKSGTNKAEKEAPPPVKYQSIDRWGWDQGLDWVKIHVSSLPDLRNVPNEDLQLTSTEDSIDFKIMNINGVNYRLFFKQLSKTISKVSFKTRRDGFILRMQKSPPEPWNIVEFAPTERIKSRTDPQDPLTKARNILLDEYDKGDERTRKLIGQAMAGMGKEEVEKRRKEGEELKEEEDGD